jgi:cytochrome P450
VYPKASYLGYSSTEIVLTCTATANMLLTLILAITKFPEVQVKARKELDAVCGTERTPLFSDFDNLPYINCIIKEGLRWRPTFVTLP